MGSPSFVENSLHLICIRPFLTDYLNTPLKSIRNWDEALQHY